MSASSNSAETDTDFTLDDDFPIDYRTPEHLWERQPTPVFDYPEEGVWLAEAIALVQKNNKQILPLLAEIRTRPFFRYYPVDLLASCGYTPSRESPCELDACEIEPHESIPPRMVERDEDEYEFELDSWARWDMPSDFTEYYDLVANPESHTAYNGTLVWRFIHNKICFQKRLDQKVNFWKRDFNRGVSGIHASVSANIIADIRNEEGDDAALVEYRRRLKDMPGAIQNLYFTYLLTLCAIEALKPRLEVCSFLGDKRAPDIMNKLLEVDIYNHPSIQRAASELREHANSSNAAAWKMRLRTRDLLGVMNCVQCNLCRLHGKVLCLGFAAILQVLLGNKGRGEEDCDENPDPYSLTRVEVGAVLTVAGKLASAIEQVEQLRALDEA